MPTRVERATYNRGEWAELFVLLKILCEQTVTVHLQGGTGTGKTLEVLRVRRGPNDDAEEFLIDGDDVVCLHAGPRLRKAEICRLVTPLLREIKSGKGQSFALRLGAEVCSLLGIKQLKRGGQEKADIHLDVGDPLTGATGWQGYTVKALIGSKPTLFNASEPTNFEFQIDPSLSANQVDLYNATNSSGRLLYGTRKMVSELMANGHTFTLVNIDRRFRDNLELLDGDMPNFLGELVLSYYGYRAGTATAVSALIESLEKLNPLRVSNPAIRYQHKIKDFLEASAYGMVPTEPYNGERTAAGGLLIVEKNGQLTCFRLDDKDRSRDYLVEHTYLETASRSRHKFGVLESHDGETRLKLNLQVRYK
jgi:type II restriction enzyme